MSPQSAVAMQSVIRSVTPRQEFPFLALRHRRLYLLSPTATTPCDQPFGMFRTCHCQVQETFSRILNRMGTFGKPPPRLIFCCNVFGG